MALNVIFMGTPEFAVNSLDSIIKAGHNVLAVVVQPDKPKGRGMKLIYPPVKEYAISKGIPVFQPDSIKNNEEFINVLKNLNPDIIVVVAYGKMLPKTILELPKLGCVNVHASLLPKYRGAAPIQWAIINGEKVTGITTIYMDEGLDTGDIIISESIGIDENDNAQDLHNKLAILGGEILIRTLDLIEKGIAPRTKQIGEVSYAPMLKKEDGWIDWSKSAEQIRNLVRGLNPWPGAYTFLHNKLLKIWQVEIINSDESFLPGVIVKADLINGLVVSTGKNHLKILELQAEGGKRMSAEQYLIGHKLIPGEKFEIKKL